MTPDARRKLRELAEKATKRKWRANGKRVEEAGAELAVAWCGEASETFGSSNRVVRIDENEALANASYIAAAHPGVIIELLDALEKAESTLREFTSEEVRPVRDRAEETRQHVDETRERIRSAGRTPMKRFKL